MIKTFPTERLTCSALALVDVPDLTAMLLEPELYTVIGGRPETSDQARTRAERWATGSPDPQVAWVNFVARQTTDGRLVGLAQATVLRADLARAENCLLAYLIDPGFQRQGLGRELMRGFAEEISRAYDPLVLTAHIAPGHVPSERIATALGLTVTDESVDGEREWRRPR